MEAMHEEMLAEKQQKNGNMNGSLRQAAGASTPLSDRSSDRSVNTGASTPLSVRSSTAPLSDHDVERLVQAIEQAGVDIAPDYKTWCEVGFALADGLGEAGREYYHRISRFYHDYDAAATDVQYDKCLKSHGEGITIATLFHYAKAAGASTAGASAPLSVRSSTAPLSVRSVNTGASASLSVRSSTASLSVRGIVRPLSGVEGAGTISDKIDVDKLPPLLRKVMAKSLSAADADLLLLGSLTCLSACMPHLCGVYDGMTVFSNLFFFANAPASSGKGRLSLCKLLVMPIHQALRQEYKMLNENEGTGLIFETEGDTLANTFSSDHDQGEETR